jgi:hypothetical protein
MDTSSPCASWLENLAFRLNLVGFLPLLRCHRVEPILLEGESHAKASERILKVVQDSGLELTLRMKHPEDLKLKWTVKT